MGWSGTGILAQNSALNIDWLKNSTLKNNLEITSASSKMGDDYANEHATQTIVEDSTSATDYSVKVTTDSAENAWAGGFCKTINPDANKRYLIKFRAKIPVGYAINYTNNTRPFNIYSFGIDGTGEWETYYAFVTTLQYFQGSVISFGFVYVKRTTASTNANVTWWYNDYKIYELSNSSNFDYIFDDENTTLTARWTQNITQINFKANGGTVNATEWGTYYSAGGVDAVTNVFVRVGWTSVGNPNTSNSAILKSGYVFAGWWTGEDGTGSMLINADGVLQVVSGYTKASGSSAVWDTLTQTITLYAKWTAQ